MNMRDYSTLHFKTHIQAKEVLLLLFYISVTVWDNITWLDQMKNVQFVDTDNITWLDQRKNVQFVDTDFKI
jgi:hypothetical protein